MKVRKILGTIMVVSMIGGYAITKLNIPTKADDKSNLKAEVINKSGDVLIKSNPSDDSEEIVGILKKGEKASIVEITENSWCKIKFNNNYGYVKIDFSNSPSKNADSDNLVVDDLVTNKNDDSVAVTSTKSQKNTYIQRTNLNKFLFIGDSYTHLLRETILKENDKNVHVHSESGSFPKDWVERLESMPENKDVEGVVLLIGVNGASTDDNKKYTKELIDKLSEKYPDKTIYVQKIFHVGETYERKNPDEFNKDIDALNDVIEKHVKTVNNAVFIDTTSGLIDENGYLKYTYDGLHINPSRNSLFYRNILDKVVEVERSNHQ